jgi:restriction system protein
VRRRQQRSNFDDLFDLLKITPIWAGPVLALLLFVVVRYGLPLLFPPKPDGIDPGIVLRPMMPMLSWFAAAIVLLAWVVAEVHKLTNRRRLDRQTGTASIRDLSWPAFEQLVSEAYRRKGYVAEVTGLASGDGGVDIVLSGRGDTVLVQCKQWRAFRVGVGPVRELHGVVVSKRATRGVLVTSGRFTRDAVAFAEQNPTIELVDGEQLAALIRSVQARPTHAAPSPPAPTTEPQTAHRPAAPACPSCGTVMVSRVARRGTKAGSAFWGCPKFPACRGTRPMAGDAATSNAR